MRILRILLSLVGPTTGSTVVQQAVVAVLLVKRLVHGRSETDNGVRGIFKTVSRPTLGGTFFD